MTEELQIRIDDDVDSGPSHGSIRSAEAPVKAAEADLTRAHAERAYLQNRLLESERQNLQAQMAAVDAEADSVELAVQKAFEDGDFGTLARRQRELANTEARRQHIVDAAVRLQNVQPMPADPVEAYVHGRTAQSANWLRSHSDFITDPLKNARLTSAHWSAVADGLVPDSPDYFESIERSIGLKNQPRTATRARSTGDDARTDGGEVTVLKPGDPIPPGAVKLSRREYELATEVLTWERGPNKGSPLGLREYLRRRQLMNSDPRWQRLEG
jgi:hypothetical protein